MDREDFALVIIVVFLSFLIGLISGGVVTTKDYNNKINKLGNKETVLEMYKMEIVEGDTIKEFKIK